MECTQGWNSWEAYEWKYAERRELVQSRKTLKYKIKDIWKKGGTIFGNFKFGEHFHSYSGCGKISNILEIISGKVHGVSNRVRVSLKYVGGEPHDTKTQRKY